MALISKSYIVSLISTSAHFYFSIKIMLSQKPILRNPLWGTHNSQFEKCHQKLRIFISSQLIALLTICCSRELPELPYVLRNIFFRFLIKFFAIFCIPPRHILLKIAFKYLIGLSRYA